MRLLFIVWLAVALSSIYGEGMRPTLIGGEPVRPGEYPEVVRIRSCEDGRCAGCTASIIGERVVLTAGHCLIGDAKISFMLGASEYQAKCKPHPFYPDTEDMDMALCKTDRKMSVKYAHVSKSGPDISDKVTLIGYGCTESPGTGGNDGILRVGESRVTRLPTSYPVNNWYYTQRDAALCYGDSGGPSYKRIRDAKDETHYVMGVNSRGNIRDLSLLTAIYLKKGLDFMRNFEDDEGVSICGLSAKCRGTIVGQDKKSLCGAVNLPYYSEE